MELLSMITYSREAKNTLHVNKKQLRQSSANKKKIRILLSNPRLTRGNHRARSSAITKLSGSNSTNKPTKERELIPTLSFT